MELKGKNILVLGLGKTGLSMVNFLRKIGANVFPYDDSQNTLSDINIDETSADYKKRSLVIGTKITVLSAEGPYEAGAEDIDDSCGLIIKKEDGTRKILSSGEISIRL